MSRADRTTPLLASDTVRAWVATGVGTGATFAAVGAYIAVALRSDEPFDRVESQAFVLLVGLLTIFVVYEALTWRTFGRADRLELTRWVRLTEPRGRGRLLQKLSGGGAASWSSQAAVFALIAVLLVTFNAELGRNPLIVVLGLAVVAASWVMVVISFALAYLRHNTLHDGLEFPGDEQPDWIDYIYLSVQVSTTFATSDVTVRTTRLRRQVTLHSLIAFVFNTVIVALLVSTLLARA